MPLEHGSRLIEVNALVLGDLEGGFGGADSRSLRSRWEGLEALGGSLLGLDGGLKIFLFACSLLGLSNEGVESFVLLESEGQIDGIQSARPSALGLAGAGVALGTPLAPALRTVAEPSRAHAPLLLEAVEACLNEEMAVVAQLHALLGGEVPGGGGLVANCLAVGASGALGGAKLLTVSVDGANFAIVRSPNLGSFEGDADVDLSVVEFPFTASLAVLGRVVAGGNEGVGNLAVGALFAELALGRGVLVGRADLAAVFLEELLRDELA